MEKAWKHISDSKNISNPLFFRFKVLGFKMRGRRGEYTVYLDATTG